MQTEQPAQFGLYAHRVAHGTSERPAQAGLQPGGMEGLGGGAWGTGGGAGGEGGVGGESGGGGGEGGGGGGHAPCDHCERGCEAQSASSCRLTQLVTGDVESISARF